MLIVAVALATEALAWSAWPLRPGCASSSPRARTSTPLAIEGYQKGCVGDSLADTRGRLEASLERESLKAQLLRECAQCNRGFGASAADRQATADLIAKLSRLPALTDGAVPTCGFDGAPGTSETRDGRWMGRGYDLRYDDPETEEPRYQPSPLAGRWRLVYASAADVLSLDASPIAGIGAIYQEISPPSSVTNVIELYPRAAALLPPGTLSSTLQLKVFTRAKARDSRRIGLTFELVSVEAQTFLGLDVTKLLPALSLPLPRLPGSGGADSDGSPAYFDILYLDTDLLIIEQNAPGGVFVAVREGQI